MTTYVCFCACGVRFAHARDARRHAREQRHRVTIIETVDARSGADVQRDV